MFQRRKTMNYFKPLFKITKTKIKKRTSQTKNKVRRTTNSRIKPLMPLEQGLLDSLLITSKWNSQQNPPKVYVGGYRIHHGFVGSLIALYGLSTENKYAVGFGLGFTVDDIADLPDWLNFEHMNPIQYCPHNIPSTFNQFA